MGDEGFDTVLRRVRTACRCCSALCGILVEARGDTVLSVRGDPENPRTKGYICPKGASLPYFHHQPGNLLAPRVNGLETGWDDALGDLTAGLRDVIDTHGPGAVAVFLGNGTLADMGGRFVAKLVNAIGTDQYYSALTVDAAPMFRAAELVGGSMELRGVWVPEETESRLALFVGVNPLVSHGYGTILPNPAARIAEFRRRGGRVWTVDPRRSRVAEVIDRHLAIRPGADAILLGWLIHELLIEGADWDYLAATTAPEDLEKLRAAVSGYDLSAAAQATGLEPQDMRDLLADIRAAGRISVISGTGVTFGEHALVTEWLRLALMIVTGSLDRRGGMWFNPGWLDPMERRDPWPLAGPAGSLSPGPKSRPDLKRLFGQYPCAALADEIEAGHIRALVLVGASPLTAIPDPVRMEKALRSLETLATIDILETPVTAFATHVLPATGQFERSDIVVETRAMFAPGVVAPMAQRRPLWWVLSRIARGLGLDIDLLQGEDPDDLDDERIARRIAAPGRDGADALIEAGSHGLMPPQNYGWVTGQVLPDGRWRLVPPDLAERLPPLLTDILAKADDGQLRVVSGRQLTRVNATSYVPPRKSREVREAHVHPDDATRNGLVAGDRVAVLGDHGRIEAMLTIDPTLRPGAVWISHGFYDPNVGALGSSQGLDPLVGQPQMTALPVRLEAIAD